jgi:hypothetical protein
MNFEILKKQANKHKKFLENKVLINPFSYEINNVDYYLAIYERGNKLKGYTVISEGEYVEDDAIKAFEKLILFTAYVNKFFEIEKAKMNLSPESFRNIYTVLDDYLKSNQNDDLSKGREKISELENLLGELQLKIKTYTHHYDNHILVHNTLDEHEESKVIEAMSHVNRLQYLQGKTLIESFNDLRNMYKEMRRLNLVQKLSEYDQTVLKEISNNIDDTKRSIKDFGPEKEIAHLPAHEQVEIISNDMRKIGKEKLPRYKQDLRYPKP